MIRYKLFSWGVKMIYFQKCTQLIFAKMLLTFCSGSYKFILKPYKIYLPTTAIGTSRAFIHCL